MRNNYLLKQSFNKTHAVQTGMYRTVLYKFRQNNENGILKPKILYMIVHIK